MGGVFAAMVDMRSSDTVKDWAEKISRQHRPADPLALPEFMAPKVPPAVAPAPVPAPRTVPVAEAGSQSPVPTVSKSSPAAPTDSSAGSKKLICMQCGSKISYAEGKFCWNNTQRFGGGQFCREHQAAFAR